MARSAERDRLCSLNTWTVIGHLRQTRWIENIPGMDGAGRWVNKKHAATGIHSVAWFDDELWAHYSFSRWDRRMPTWEQTRDWFHEWAGPEALGVIVVPPVSEHVNIAEVAHVWQRLDARPLPDFTMGTGSI